VRKIIGSVFVSLDGVMQAPGGPNEDPTGGFDLGGWLANYFDEDTGQAVDELFSRPFDLLLGRRTYDIFAAYWPYAEGENEPMGAMFDRVGKYVVTRGDQPLEWQNSHRVQSLDALAELKRNDGPDLVIQGSSTLYPQLLAAGLLDRLTLMTFPVVLGNGKRLFGDGTPPGAMKMVGHKVSPGGNIIATYEPAGAVKPGSFAVQEPSKAEIARQEAIEEGAW
jgi:dihydrofolate reductase